MRRSFVLRRVGHDWRKWDNRCIAIACQLSDKSGNASDFKPGPKSMSTPWRLCEQLPCTYGLHFSVLARYRPMFELRDIANGA